MSTRNGILVQRRLVESYKGFDIVKVIVTDYENVDNNDSYLTFCESGAFNRPSMAYNIYPHPKNVEEVKECIDKFLNDDTLYFTDYEMVKYVYAPNRKYDWSFSKKRLLNLFKKWDKATPRIKILYEDRLTDANFHSECSVLSEEGYEAAVAWVEKHWL